MAHIVIMPRQGNTVESCVIVGWKVAEGQSVSAAQPVCEVETDKASFEVPAGIDGVVLKILHPEGDDVPVLKPIAVIGQSGEDWAAALAGAGGEIAVAVATATEPVSAAIAATGEVVAEVAPAVEAPVAAAPVAGFASPRARNLAATEGLPLNGVAGTGPEGRIIERDVVAALAQRPALTAAARALAGSGAAVPQAGTAFGGRAGVADFAAASLGGVAPNPAAAGQPVGKPAAIPATAAADFPGAFADTPVKGIRRIIADRMRASLSQTAQLTLNTTAPADRLMALRSRFKAGSGGPELSGVTVGDLVLAAVARTLPKFPFLNAHMKGDSIRSFERVHLGLAVDTPRGLMVPVIRNADLLSLTALSVEAKRLAAACLGGTVLPDELSGSTFTVTNLGAFGIESFTPVLNTPEVGILGLCAVVDRPVPASDGKGIILEKRMGLSLTIDHQAVDGAPGARFLQALSAAIADIDLLLLK